MDKKELAKKIVAKATITKHEKGYDVDLIGVVGYRKEVVTSKKSEAIAETEKFIYEELKAGSLELSKDFIRSL